MRVREIGVFMAMGSLFVAIWSAMAWLLGFNPGHASLFASAWWLACMIVVLWLVGRFQDQVGDQEDRSGR